MTMSCVINVRLSTHNVMMSSSQIVTWLLKLRYDSPRTIGRIVDGHARSKQDGKLLNLEVQLLPEDSIFTFQTCDRGYQIKLSRDELYQRALKVYDSQVAKLRDE